MQRSKTILISGKKLRQAIKDKGLTFKELSLTTGFSSGYVSDCISRGVMGGDALEEIAKQLSAAPEDFEAEDYCKPMVGIDSEKIREIIHKKKLLQIDVSKRVGMSATWLCETLKTGQIKSAKLPLLANALGVNAEDIVAEEKQEETMLPIVYGERVYTKAETMDMMRKAVNAFADHILDYFADVLDGIEEGMK